MNKSLWVKLFALATILLGIGWTAKGFGLDVSRLNPDNIRTYVLSFGVWAPAVYLLAYGQPLLPFPASVMTITGGLAFGPAWGTLAALMGATFRACNQFLVARLLGRQAVERLLKGRIAALDDKLGNNAFKAVFLIRLIPNLPFDVQNYGLGFSKVRFFPYALATFLGMIPGGFAYVYLGYSLTDPKQIWKLGLAIVLILGLIFGQKAWKTRHGNTEAQ